MTKLKCIFCKNLTYIKEVNVKKKINTRIIAIKDVPAYECRVCNEIFYPAEIAVVIKYAIENLSHKQIILYEDALYEYQKNTKRSITKSEIRSLGIKEIKNLREEQFIFQDVFYGGYYQDCIRCQEEKLTQKEIEENTIVLVYHHSKLKPLKGTILLNKTQNCLLALSKDFAILNFLEGDPIVIRFSYNHIGYNIGAEVQIIDKENQTLVISINDLHLYREKRSSDRIPVSIFAEITRLNSVDKQEGIIKDISQHGLLICTNTKFLEGCPVEVYIHTTLKIITVAGTIVREHICTNNNEYGIEIVKISKDDLECLKQFIMRL